MATLPADSDPFDGLTDEANVTLRELLDAEGLGGEAPDVLPAFKRAIRAAVAAVQSGLPADLPLDFALAYLTGRIAREQVIALQNARTLANTARARAEDHWRGAIETERRRLAQEPPIREASNE
jgi:hypothetical protein